MEHLKESKQVNWEAIIKDDESASSPSFHSSSSSNMVDDDHDDASSLFNSSPHSRGPLYDLSDLIAQLPIKRGLSKFYNGKSKTFASLSNLSTDEELGKNEMMNWGIRRRMKPYKGGNLHELGPKAAITKRSTSPKLSFKY